MAAITTNVPPFHDLEYASSYTPLPSHLPSDSSRPANHRKAIKVLVGIFLSLLFLVSLIAVILYQGPKLQQQVNVIQEKSPSFTSVSPANLTPASRGVSQGVSEKMVRDVSGGTGPYPWTNDMLSWQRTAFHFQPEENWMNDPNGPLFYKGWYHLFYQYNPDSAIWGNITWGHAVSKDLIHWLYLPIAMEPDQWYDINGVWTGSATILPNGEIVMLYTGDTDKFVQVQNLAYPADPDDSLLRNWVKYPGNPVLVPPPGIGPKDFRDPTTGWIAPDGAWMITIGSKVNKTGVALVYKTINFTSFQLLDGYLHAVPGTGMWECVDFFPISTSHENGLDTSVNGLGVKHFLKASLDGNKRDYYALGTYDPIKNRWTPDNPRLDVGFGLRLDYGNYYASKTFYDQSKQRRILWGWIGETDTESADIKKGWASIQTIPRTVVFDKKTRTNILQWPVDEVESLRSNSTEFKNVGLEPGSVVPLDIGPATQLDIVATFEVNEESFVGRAEANADYKSTSNEGVSSRGIFGPFGLLVLADDTFSEQTPVYFYLTKDSDGKIDTHFCADQSRSSKASDVGKVVYGSRVPVLDNEKLTMRLLVDHSIVESFAQGGRSVITSRIYPTKAIYGAARVFLFNNATGLSVSASVKIWHMNSAYIYPFPADSTPI